MASLYKAPPPPKTKSCMGIGTPKKCQIHIFNKTGILCNKWSFSTKSTSGEPLQPTQSTIVYAKVPLGVIIYWNICENKAVLGAAQRGALQALTTPRQARQSVPGQEHRSQIKLLQSRSQNVEEEPTMRRDSSGSLLLPSQKFLLSGNKQAPRLFFQSIYKLPI